MSKFSSISSYRKRFGEERNVNSRSTAYTGFQYAPTTPVRLTRTVLVAPSEAVTRLLRSTNGPGTGTGTGTGPGAGAGTGTGPSAGDGAGTGAGAVMPRLSSDAPNLSLSDAVKSKFKANQTNEKAELHALNERFVSYIEKVHLLERRNRVMSTELERTRRGGATRVAELYEEEMRELRRQVDRLSAEKARAELRRDNLAEDVERIRDKLQGEILQREEAESSMQSFRQDVDNAALARVDLERKVTFLKDEITFMKKLHEEEILELQGQFQQQQQVDVEVVKPDLSAALRDVRQQYENLTSKNIHQSEEWYKFKFADLSKAANKNSEALRAPKQEAGEHRRQVQTLTCEVNALKGMNESLERQMREMEERFCMECSVYQDTIARLEEDLRTTKDEMTRYLHNYQDLLNVKMALDVEITTHRKLLEGEESRISAPLPDISALNLRDHFGPNLILETTEESTTITEAPATTTKRVLIKGTETKDGQVVNESTQNHEDQE